MWVWVPMSVSASMHTLAPRPSNAMGIDHRPCSKEHVARLHQDHVHRDQGVLVDAAEQATEQEVPHASRRDPGANQAPHYLQDPALSHPLLQQWIIGPRAASPEYTGCARGGAGPLRTAAGTHPPSHSHGRGALPAATRPAATD